MAGTRTLDRRTFLRGAGAIAIALPLLEEMGPAVAQGAPGDPPVRVLTTFFGLGLDPEWQAQKFSGPLGPYEPLQDKMAFFTNVNMNQGSGGAHCENSPVVFVGEKNPDENRAGGASVDQLVRQALDPAAPVLVSGVWWRRGACDGQALRVWNADGTARPPIKRPSEVFDKLFGSLIVTPPGQDPDPALLRELHLKRSIVDTVMGQYKHMTGPSSPLGAASKQKLELHLQSIREVEQQLAPAAELLGEGGALGCGKPEAPSDPSIGVDYDKFTYGTGSGAPVIHWQDYRKLFRLHADLWVAALRCDLVRYGNLMYESAGGHTNFEGSYSAMGESTSFPGDSQHDSYFHANKPKDARLVQHLAQDNMAYFLKQLDAYQEPNGRTLLDNSTVVVGTEYGWNHSSKGVFHAIAGGKGRFRSGFHTQTLNAIDVYNLVLAGHGLDQTVGKASGVSSEGDASSALA